MTGLSIALGPDSSPVDAVETTLEQGDLESVWIEEKEVAESVLPVWFEEHEVVENFDVEGWFVGSIDDVADA